MVQAGAKPVNWPALVSEWAPDYTKPENMAVAELYNQHGGAVSLAAQYVMAQISAGVVKAPEWFAQPVTE
ncbi:hypothetical protein [Streptomyces sp. 8K308]|uniref:hypothetical protein n=1 Tax=Streptomyces sp. 8K308 TaxID=2530388 RepID=UPI001FB59E61|nr:hypothetical protein [Streptomyces sp. 8K308]